MHRLLGARLPSHDTERRVQGMMGVGFPVGARPASGEHMQKDVTELITVVLPCCKHRPSVYNEISKTVLDLLRKIDALQQSEETHPPDEDFVWFLPQVEYNSIIELRKDRRLLGQLIKVDIAQQPNVRSLLKSLRDQVQSDIDSFNDIKKRKAIQFENERAYDLQILGFVLRHVMDRPHIYNRVVVELQKLQHEAFGQEIRTSGRSSYLYKTPLRWKQEEHPTSSDRWQDVVTLDEIIDTVPETKLFLRDLLLDLKEACQEDARELQKVETGILKAVSNQRLRKVW
jgi:hypothetical protein